MTVDPKKTFQSPLGEVVKETFLGVDGTQIRIVSIPSRGSGKGDKSNTEQLTRY